MGMSPRSQGRCTGCGGRSATRMQTGYLSIAPDPRDDSLSGARPRVLLLRAAGTSGFPIAAVR